MAVVSYRGVRRHATTYAELATLSGRFAAEIHRRGIAPGERVVLWGNNSAEWIAALFGCLLRGVLAIPFDAAESSEFAIRVVTDVVPKLILADNATSRRCPPIFRIYPSMNWGLTSPHNQSSRSLPPVTLYAPFQVIFNSGTTSEPKSIVHTNRNVLASLDHIEHETLPGREIRISSEGEILVRGDVVSGSTWTNGSI